MTTKWRGGSFNSTVRIRYQLTLGKINAEAGLGNAVLRPP